MTRNLAASVRARLKHHADATKQDFNLTLTHYGLERLLYRLSVSEHASNFLLKGALLFTLWYDVAHRPTRDADLLGFGPDDVDTAVKTFRQICQTPAEDGVVFDLDSVKGSIIRKEAGYGGVRIDIQAKLDGARISLQVDIGFLIDGDGLVYRISSSRFARMMRNPAEEPLPNFANQRIRCADLVIELIDRIPSSVCRETFAILEFDHLGHLDTGRF